MPNHFAAFTFVDRITECTDTRARGLFLVPGHLAEFPSSLVAESVGQLASWVGMAQIGFRGRPVAALASETRFHGDVAPGQTLELGVDIESCDEYAIAYDGWARVNGTLLLELEHCLGPFLPVEEFDSPDALRRQYEVFCGPGAKNGRFKGVVEPEVVPIERVAGRSLRATLHVPTAAPFFDDHFPRRPVFPATLLLNTLIRSALKLAGEGARWRAGAKPVPSKVNNVKVRSFIGPGEAVEIYVELVPPIGDTVVAKLGARINHRSAATARLEITAREAA